MQTVRASGVRRQHAHNTHTHSSQQPGYSSRKPLCGQAINAILLPTEKCIQLNTSQNMHLTSAPTLCGLISSELGNGGGSVTFNATPNARFRASLMGPAFLQEIRVSHEDHNSSDSSAEIYGAFAAPPGKYCLRFHLVYRSFMWSTVTQSYPTNVPVLSIIVIVAKNNTPRSLPPCSFGFSLNRGSYFSINNRTGESINDPIDFDPFSRHDEVLAKRLVSLYSFNFESPSCNWRDHSRFVEEMVIKTLIASKKMCIFGDSQHRNLHNAIALMIEKRDSLSVMSISGIERKMYYPSKYHISSSNFSIYVPDPWGRCFDGRNSTSACGLTDDDCHTVLINTGQWFASYINYFCLDGNSYKNIVRQVLIQAKAIFKSSKVVWLTVQSNGDVSAHHEQGRRREVQLKDWRTFSVLEQYSSLSIDVANALRIPYLDIFGMISILNNLPPDGSHFDTTSTEQELARLVLTELTLLL